MSFEATSSYRKTNINGWTVYFSSQFAQNPKDQAMIAQKIQRETAFLARTLTRAQLRVLRKADLWVETGTHYRALARYHGSKGEIFQENLNPQKYRDVEFFGRYARVRQPTLVLHELAHVYHDRKLSWKSSKIERLYNAFAARSAKAKDRCGKPKRAYALENNHEFFATFTEAYFAKTCTYPFDRATIKRHHPEMYSFLVKTWGS